MGGWGRGSRWSVVDSRIRLYLGLRLAAWGCNANVGAGAGGERSKEIKTGVYIASSPLKLYTIITNVEVLVGKNDWEQCSLSSISEILQDTFIIALSNNIGGRCFVLDTLLGSLFDFELSQSVVTIFGNCIVLILRFDQAHSRSNTGRSKPYKHARLNSFSTEAAVA